MVKILMGPEAQLGMWQNKQKKSMGSAQIPIQILLSNSCVI